MTDSGTDLSPEMAKQLDIEILDLMVIMDTDPTPKPNSSVDPKEFYAFLRSKHTATTSAVNSDAFAEAMERRVNEGKDVLYLGFSSGLSNTFNAGRLAAEEICEKYPDSKIYAIDTIVAFNVGY